MINPVKWKTTMDILSKEEIEAIHDGTLKILEHTGISMTLSESRLNQLQDLGLRVDRDNNRIYFPREVVEGSVKKAPSNYTLYARNPEYDLQINGKCGYLTLDGCGLQILDLETDIVRNSTKDDLENAIRAADALPQISFLWPCISAQDCNPQIQPLHEFHAMLTNSSKHIQAMTAVDPLNAKATIEMAAAEVGGLEKLKERPIISNFQCSISPLAYEEKCLEAAFAFAELGIPTGFVTMQIGGGTAPITLAGNIVVGNAEILAGITLLQLLYPGTPTFYGSCATMMDLLKGGVTCGGPDDFLLQGVSSQLARFYQIPSNIGTFATGAKASDWHSGVENTMSGAISMFTKADMMCGAGLINGATIFSYEQLLLDCEIYDLLSNVSKGLIVNNETLALETIEQVGPRNHFLMENHTINNMRNIWVPNIIDRSSYEDWVSRGKKSPNELAKEKAKSILESHEPLKLKNNDEVKKVLDYYEGLASSNEKASY